MPIIDQSNTRSSNVEERKPILNRCAPEIMQSDAVGDRYRIGMNAEYDMIRGTTSVRYRSKVFYNSLGNALRQIM